MGAVACVWLLLSWRAFPPPRRAVEAAVLIVADEYAQREYARSIASVRAYARLQQYGFVLWDPWSDAPINRVDCVAHTHLVFRRHCVARCLLRDAYPMLVAIDADVAVADARRRIETLFLTPLHAVVHEERFHTGEVHAGAYAVRRGAFADDYLRRWAQMEARLPYLKSADNGALHLHLLNTLYGEGSPQAMQCEALWSSEIYDHYVGCAMSHIFNASSAELRLVRRGHGFCRDLWVTEGRTTDGVDFLVHAIHSFQPMPGPMSSVAVMRPVMIDADRAARRTRPHSVLERARIDHCWPHCPEYWT